MPASFHAATGLMQAKLSLAQESESVQARAHLENTLCCDLPASLHGTMDAVYSHRTLHLMDEKNVRDFALAAHALLKSQGMVCSDS